MPDDTKTIDDKKLDHSKASSTTDGVWSDNSLIKTGPTFIPFGDRFDTGTSTLNIDEDWGYSGYETYSARCPEKPSFTSQDQIRQIRKADQGWFGNKIPFV